MEIKIKFLCVNIIAVIPFVYNTPLFAQGWRKHPLVTQIEKKLLLKKSKL
jgi:hypothetical protein